MKPRRLSGRFESYRWCIRSCLVLLLGIGISAATAWAGPDGNSGDLSGRSELIEPDRTEAGVLGASAGVPVVAEPRVSSQPEIIDEAAALEEAMARKLAEPPSVPLSPGATRESEPEDAQGGVATAGNTRANSTAFAPTFVRIEQDDADWLYTDSWSSVNLTAPAAAPMHAAPRSTAQRRSRFPAPG